MHYDGHDSFCVDFDIKNITFEMQYKVVHSVCWVEEVDSSFAVQFIHLQAGLLAVKW